MDDLGVPLFWKHPCEALHIFSLVKYLQPSSRKFAGPIDGASH